jgi:transcription termination/antitermination protein NusG
MDGFEQENQSPEYNEQDLSEESPTLEEETMEDSLDMEMSAGGERTADLDVDLPEGVSEEEFGASQDEDGRAWYVVHCYSGYENKVRHNLEQRIETMGMKDKIFDVVVPTEEEIEVKDGKRRTVERRVFPGYILVQDDPDRGLVVRGPQHPRGDRIRGHGQRPRRRCGRKRCPRLSSAWKPKRPADQGDVQIWPARAHRRWAVQRLHRGTVAEMDMERAKVRVMVNVLRARDAGGAGFPAGGEDLNRWEGVPRTPV